MVAVLTILAFGAMGLMIAAVSHVGIARERRAILAAQAQMSEQVVQTEPVPKPAPSTVGKVMSRQITLDGQRVLALRQKPKRIRVK